MEFIELDGHPFWVGTQAHPEFKSRPDRPAPLFREFVGAALARAEGRNPHLLRVVDDGSIELACSTSQWRPEQSSATNGSGSEPVGEPAVREALKG